MDQPVSVESQAAAQYRRRAEELRAIAESYRNPETNRVLNSIARDYERMAATFEDIEPTCRTTRTV